MRGLMRFAMLTGVMLAGLSGCGGDLPDYRYKMTIHVVTPQGDRAYSSVRQIHSEYVSSIMSSSGKTIRDALEGEAVIMDLPSGKTVYALLSRPENPEYAKYITGPALGPYVSQAAAKSTLGGSSKNSQFLDEIVSRRQAMLNLKGRYKLPEFIDTGSSSKTYKESKKMWPTFVEFADPNRPSSIYEVEPHALGISSIFIEITDELPSSTITQKLPWLSDYKRSKKSLSGDSGGIVTTNDLKDVLGTGAFLQGYDK
ncbi:hypothetical protein [Sphingomonas faeni]|uniref:hypothetical protein n=1 Tax=Sphingomonas faeni TaxID=185950 RepID=UPI00335AA530